MASITSPNSILHLKLHEKYSKIIACPNIHPTEVTIRLLPKRGSESIGAQNSFSKAIIRHRTALPESCRMRFEKPVRQTCKLQC